MSTVDEPQPGRYPSSNDILTHMSRGAGIGALTAGTVGAGSLVLLITLRDIGQDAVGHSLMMAGVMLSCISPFGLVSGFLAGALVGLADSLTHRRLSAGHIPLWVWAIAGALLGALGSSLSMELFDLITMPLSDTRLPFGLFAHLGATGGAVAGPVFGWLFHKLENDASSEG